MSDRSLNSQLITPKKIGPITLKNRIVMGPMHVRLEEKQDGWTRLQDFYTERATNNVGCIITGGVSPNHAGRFDSHAIIFDDDAAKHYKPIVEAVKSHGCKFVLQILHTGRLGHHPDIVAPSPIPSPINSYRPAELSHNKIIETIEDYAACAERAVEIGFDGVEIMGCEGYLISQFLAPATNKRVDDWGDSFQNRCAFAECVVEGIRQRIGDKAAIFFRLSLIDLIDHGCSWNEVCELTDVLAKSGVDAIHVGIGWHESRVPTVSGIVPENAFGKLVERIKWVTDLPILSSVKIHSPEAVNDALDVNHADFICISRPLLSDPKFATKLINGDSNINYCISCNQSCLDNVFLNNEISCLVNPRACRESLYDESQVFFPQNILVVGAGPAGLIAAHTAAKRGHHVTIAEADNELGGLLRYAAKIPGKERFSQTISYYEKELELHNVTILKNFKVTSEWVTNQNFEQVVIATGATPNSYRIPGDNGMYSHDYLYALDNQHHDTDRIVVIGAGKIGIDVALHLLRKQHTSYYQYWGLDLDYIDNSGLTYSTRSSTQPQITFLQRSNKSYKRGLGPTTAWSISELLESSNIEFVTNAHILSVDDNLITYSRDGKIETIEANQIIYCTGQTQNHTIYEELKALNIPLHLIGSAKYPNGTNALISFEEGYKIGCML